MASSSQVLASDAKRLTDFRIADVNISALALLVATSSTNVGIASNDGSFALSQVIGIALSTASAGNRVNVLFMGRLNDPFFTFPVNDSLYLGTNGSIINIPPSTPTAIQLTDVGYSQGAGSIFLNIQKPMIL